jgi:hypothetical protein
LIERHGREIFPLLRKRYLFASSQRFRLYDLKGGDGSVNENVFAFSNGTDTERALVVYNNSYERTDGFIHATAPYTVKTQNGREERGETLGTALGLGGGEHRFCIFREQRSGLWFIRRSNAIRDRGLYVSLDGYQTSVFLDIHERSDSAERDLARLEGELGGAGVADIDSALMGLELRPAQSAFGSVATGRFLREVGQALMGSRGIDEERFSEVRRGYRDYLIKLTAFRKATRSVGYGVTSLERHLSAVLSIPHLDTTDHHSGTYRRAIGRYLTGLKGRSDRTHLVTAWVLTVPTIEMYGDPELPIGQWGIDGWIDFSQVPDADPERLRRSLRIAARLPEWEHALSAPTPRGEEEPSRGQTAVAALDYLLASDDVPSFLSLHSREDNTYYDSTAMDELLWIVFSLSLIRTVSTSPLGGRTAAARVETLYDVVSVVETANESSGGSLEHLRATLTKKRAARATRRQQRPGRERAGSKKAVKKDDAEE